MTANIFIQGVIGGDYWNSDEGDQGTTLADVRRQLTSYSYFDKITVFINSPGGDVDEGFAIHDYLRSQGKPVTTVAEGQVFSIASVIFLSGDEDKRLISGNASIMIHNPTPSFGVWGDAEELEKVVEMLRSTEDRIINFYNQKTGIEKNQLRDWMNADTFFVGNDAVSKGFASGIYETLAAVAYMRPQDAKFREMDNNKTVVEKIRALLNLEQKPETPEPTPPEKDEEKDEENAELVAAKARIAELETALAAQSAATETAQTELATVQTEVTNQKTRLLQIEAHLKELEDTPLGKETPATPPPAKVTNLDPAVARWGDGKIFA